MRTKTNYIIGGITAFILFILTYGIASAQPENQETLASEEQETSETQSTINALKGIIRSLDELQDQIKNEKRRQREVTIQDERAEIAKEIDTLKQRVESLNGNFESIATGLDIEAFAAKPQKSFNWKDEVQVLVGPIMNELKNMTARPRLIENLRTQVSYYEKQISMVKDALENLHALVGNVQDETLKGKLAALEENWRDKGEQISSQLTVVKYQLADKLKEKTSLLESGHKIVRMFFKSRGRNFILSASAFLFVFLLLRYFHQRIYKGSAIQKKVSGSFYVRLADVLYHIFTFVGATGALLTVLYFCADWVLLGLAFVLIIGLIWTAKQTLPRFYEQCTILLNLGSIKENERVIYNGLPWKVESLHVYTILSNPELKGGRIRLPLNDVKDMKSRPYHPDEPWFPCKEGEFVMLADSTMGKVTIQTPEIVQLSVAGGSCKTYPTSEFLNQNPVNLSKNFSVKTLFGIDYQHQAICTTEVPVKLKEAVKDGLIREGLEKDIINIIVEFKEMGDSSLDYDVIAVFSGRVAQDYGRLSRIIQRLTLEASNKYGWVIPYQTITVHTAR